MSDEYIELMEIGCPECDERFMLSVPDEPANTEFEHEFTCPHCDWTNPVTMEVVRE